MVFKWPKIALDLLKKVNLQRPERKNVDKISINFPEIPIFDIISHYKQRLVLRVK